MHRGSEGSGIDVFLASFLSFFLPPFVARRVLVRVLSYELVFSTLSHSLPYSSVHPLLPAARLCCALPCSARPWTIGREVCRVRLRTSQPTMLSPSQTFSLKTPPFTSLSLLLSPFLVLLFPLSQQTVSPPQHLGGPQLRFLPSPSPATTAPPTYPPNLALLRRGQGQSQTSGAGQSSCPSDQVSCGNGCAYDCCDGQAGLNGWACRVSGEKCFTKSGYVGCCKGR